MLKWNFKLNWIAFSLPAHWNVVIKKTCNSIHFESIVNLLQWIIGPEDEMQIVLRAKWRHPEENIYISNLFFGVIFNGDLIVKTNDI